MRGGLFAPWIVKPQKVFALMILAFAGGPGACAPEAANRATPVAVLGDSDSHSYHDALNGVARGGTNNAATFNWLEVWTRLRPGDINPGPFVASGERRFAARAMSFLGAPTRAPRKRDYLYNYAWSGARCASLREEWPEQARWLLARLRSEPARWKDGLVVIRIGINDFGQAEHLKAWARDPAAAAPHVDACLASIAATVAAIRKASTVHIALIGVARDYDAPFAGPEVLPDAAVPAVETVLQRFDDGLAAIAVGDARIAFVGDVAWFEVRYGARRDGTLAPSARIAGVEVFNLAGNDASRLHTKDGHAGTVASGLFVQYLINDLNGEFGWTWTAPTDEEIIALAQP